MEEDIKILEEYRNELLEEEIREYRNNFIPKSKVKEKIEELDKRIDYLDKELTEAYIVREKLGTETDIDTNEQYIYNMEQERSIRHAQKYAYKELLEEQNTGNHISRID